MSFASAIRNLLSPRATAADFRAAAPPATTRPAAAPALASSEADYARATLPEAVDPRSRPGQVIRILASNKTQVAWYVVCDRPGCGATNQISVGDEHRRVTCFGGCGKQFSIHALAEDATRRARFAHNQVNGTNIKIDKPMTDEEWDNWRFTLPELIPSREASRASKLQDRLNGPDGGEVTWAGGNYGSEESFANGMGFSDPYSASRH